MALLEIIHLTGELERRDLYKRQPMSIGSHSSNDLRIEEDGVEIMHARVSWNKEAWEVVAAGTAPIDVNGTLVKKAALTSGDTLRFGTIDVRFVDPDGSPPKAVAPIVDEIGLRPGSEEIKIAQKVENRKVASGTKPAAPTKKTDEDLAKSLEMLAFDSRGSSKKKGKPARDEDDPFESIDDDDETPAVSPPKASPKAAPAKPQKPAPKEVVVEAAEAFEEVEDTVDSHPKPSLLHAVTGKPKRPGEQDPVKSPIVLFLLGTIVLATLVGLAFYFIAGRRTTLQIYEEAVSHITEGKLNQGVEALNKFVTDFPKHEKVPEAEIMAGFANVDMVSTANSNFGEAVKRLRDFAGAQREKPGFDALKDQLASRAGIIATGAAEMAAKQNNRELLAAVDSARLMLVNFSPKESQPTVKLRAIDDAKRTAELKINKTGELKSKIEAIKAELTAKKPMAALIPRRALLADYPDFEKQKEIRDLMTQTLELERSLVVSDDPNTAAETTDADTLPAPKVLAVNARSKNDQVSVNEVVWVQGKDCLYGVDTVTGLPLWRRPVGADPAFFPLEEGTLPSLIAYDSERDELVRVNRLTGALVWRQALGERASGKPLLDGGQIYLTTEGGALLKIDIQTGSIVSRLKFSQHVVGPAAIGDEHLVVIGDQDMGYVLTRTPLACVGVSYLGQKAQSIAAPLVSMGPYVLFVENQSEAASTLRLLTRDATTGLTQVATAPVAGMVVDEPVVRGRDLFVPSSVERVSAFSVSDVAGEKPLTVGPVFQVQGAQGSPIYLTLGPERQVWMASSALRRLQLVTDVIQPDSKEAAVGISSQPIQSQGPLLFNARRRPFTDAITLTQTERDTLESEWQVVTGARLLAISPYEGGDAPSLVAINEAGASFRLSEAMLSDSGFISESANRLTIDEGTKGRLYGGPLPDAQVAVACGEPQARLWVINRLGQVERQAALPANPQGNPVPMGKKVVVPLVGRLHVAQSGAGDTPVQDFEFPSGEKPPIWKQLLPVDNTTVVALTEDGVLLQIRQQQNPSPHLAEVSRVALPGPTIGEMAIAQGRFAVACPSGDVQVYEATKLEPQGRRVFDPAPSGPAFVTEAGVIVETGRNALHCLNLDEGLTSKWQIATEGATLAGSPLLVDGKLVLAFRDGQVLTVDPATGQTVTEQWVSGRLDSGPFQFAKQTFVLTWDGGFQRLTPAP